MIALDLNLTLGVLGALVQLIAFALNLLGRTRHDSVAYVSMNAIGCVATSYYAIATNSIPFLLLEATWGFFAFYKLAGMLNSYFFSSGTGRNL
jgi:hypothetical protein